MNYGGEKDYCYFFSGNLNLTALSLIIILLPSKHNKARLLNDISVALKFLLVLG